MRLRIPHLILLVALAFFVICLWRDAATLPEKVATHFNGTGHPNGWMTRAQHLTFSMFFGLVMPAFVIGLCYSIRFFPSSLLNVPNAAYWRSPEHYTEACRILSSHSLWFASMLLVWMTLINHQIVAANRTVPAHLDSSSIWVLGGGLVACSVLWVVTLLLRFSRIPKAQ